MPKFQDLKTALAISDSKRKLGDFTEYAERVHEYSASEDPATNAFERAYFSDKEFHDENEMLPKDGDAVLSLERELLPVLAKMESD